MIKLNKLGLEVLEYKGELNKDYPEIVKKSLALAIDELAKNGIIDIDVHYALKDNSSTRNDLEIILTNKDKYMKTEAQLLEEFEVLRVALVDALRNPISHSESNVLSDEVKVFVNFTLTTEFLENFFLIESQKEFETIMKLQGFAHKFALLRLEKIMKDFFEYFDFKKINGVLKPSYSHVFYHDKTKVYGIHLEVALNIECLEDEKLLNEIAENIDLLNEEANTFFKNKMTY